jgi:hypothetical protein
MTTPYEPPKRPRRKHGRTKPSSWQNDPDKASEVNRTPGSKSRDPAVRQAAYADHPKNDRGENICYASVNKGASHCPQHAGKGTDHEGYGKCALHGGNTPSLSSQAGKLLGAEVAGLMTKNMGYGVPIAIGPEEALLKEIGYAAGHVAWIEERIALMWPMDVTRAITEVQQQWLDLLHKERTMLAKHAKMALDAGVAERKIRLAEQTTALFVGALNRILEGLHLSVEQQKLVPVLVPAIMRELSQQQYAPQVIEAAPSVDIPMAPVAPK